ncbi:MAG: hypothetical protein NG747_09790 [Candidatus Brocadia sp.]|nr:hypothetical protein [Candidatus Brocadia sp.]
MSKETAYLNGDTIVVTVVDADRNTSLLITNICINLLCQIPEVILLSFFDFGCNGYYIFGAFIYCRVRQFKWYFFVAEGRNSFL